MPGQFGVERHTIQNIEIVKVDEERNLLFLRGSVPGHRSGFVTIRESVKKKKES